MNRKPLKIVGGAIAFCASVAAVSRLQPAPTSATKEEASPQPSAGTLSRARGPTVLRKQGFGLPRDIFDPYVAGVNVRTGNALVALAEFPGVTVLYSDESHGEFLDIDTYSIECDSGIGDPGNCATADALLVHNVWGTETFVRNGTYFEDPGHSPGVRIAFGSAGFTVDHGTTVIDHYGLSSEGGYLWTRTDEMGGPSSAPYVTNWVQVVRGTNSVQVVDSRGWVTQANYNAEGRLGSIRDPYGRQYNFGYMPDFSGYEKLRTMTGPSAISGYSLTWMFEYDTIGNIRAITEPTATGNFTTVFDRGLGEYEPITAIKYQLGDYSPGPTGWYTTTFNFQGGPTEVTDSFCRTESFLFSQWARHSRIASYRGPDGPSLFYDYDGGGGQLTQVVDTQLKTGTEYVYDGSLHLIMVSEVRNDGSTQPLTMVSGPWVGSTGFQPSNVEDVATGITTTLAVDSATGLRVDSVNRPLRVTDSIGNTETYAYTSLPNSSSCTAEDAQRPCTRLAMTMNSASDGEVTFDSKGDVVVTTAGNGSVVSRTTRESHGLPTSMVYPGLTTGGSDPGLTTSYLNRSSNQFFLPRQITESGMPTITVGSLSSPSTAYNPLGQASSVSDGVTTLTPFRYQDGALAGMTLANPGLSATQAATFARGEHGMVTNQSVNSQPIQTNDYPDAAACPAPASGATKLSPPKAGSSVAGSNKRPRGARRKNG